MEDTITFVCNPRMAFSAPPGRVIISLDFSNQEAQIAAVLSGDQAMCEAFLVPEKLIDKDGKEYVNPYSDLHTLTAVKCVSPELFKGVPESKWRELADKSGKRKPAKIVNFGILFGSTYLAISELNYVKAKVAEEWVNNHKKTYHRFHQWAEQYGNISECRGFAIAPVTLHQRWVDEANSKGSGESPARSAVNFAIQGSAATATKLSLIRLHKLFKGTTTKLVGVIHDEILIETDGELELNLEKCEIKDNVYDKVSWKYSDNVQKVIDQAAQVMCDVETEMYKEVGSEIKGRVGKDCGPYWAH